MSLFPKFEVPIETLAFCIGSMHFGSLSLLQIFHVGRGDPPPCRLPSSRPCHVTNAPLSPAHDVAHPDAVQQNIAQPGDSRGTYYGYYMVNINGYDGFMMVDNNLVGG